MTPLLLLFLAATPAPAAAPSFDVGGTVAVTDTEELAVTVQLTNRGGIASGPVAVQGEMGGRFHETRVASGVRPGETAAARLVFPLDVTRPGLHPLVLLLDYSPEGVRADPPSLSQRAFLLLTLGAAPAPALRVSATDITLLDRASMPVVVESVDGAAHRVRVRVLGPRGLNAQRLEDQVLVPASGRAELSVPLLRGGAPRPSRQGVLVVAETLDGDVAQAGTATAVVSVEADPARMPRLRVPIVVVAALLLLVAAVIEWVHLRRARRAALPPAA